MRGERLKNVTRNKTADFLWLQKETGESIVIPKDWTDRADPDFYKPLSSPLPTLSFSHLLQLFDLIEFIKNPKSKKLRT